MKVYFAARYSRKKEIAELAALARKVGVIIVSEWHDEKNLPISESSFDVNKDIFLGMAKSDLKDLAKAETLVFFSEDPNVGVPRGGRHVEFGYFLHMKKDNPEFKIIIVGPIENLFNLLADEQFPDVPSFIYEMAQRLEF